MARRTLLLSLVALALAASTAAAKPKPWELLPLPPPMPAATSSGHVEVADGAKIYYAIYGRTDGKADPVILLHGGMGNSDHFGFQVPDLVDRFQVIVIDSRGQGRSTLSKAKLSYHAMATDVVAVMDALKIGKAALVGWSDGGEIALDLAIHHPDRVAKLFVFGSNYDANGHKPNRNPTTFQSYNAKCASDFAKISKDPKKYQAVVEALLPVWRNPAVFTKDQLRSIKAPTVVSDGEFDEIIELAQVREMATLIPNAKLIVFPNTSHFALWQDPLSFNKALVEFLIAK
ncbi:MAG: alpha/beta hydrolase [Deltaproteobacteria bacterium]|nr:alpha/beta hydrolase [Deltaproteobacteria bacterium]